MPIDANIINGLKPVQFDGANIVNMLQRGQALRMQQESHAQEMQSGALDLKAKQNALDQTKAVNDAYQGSLTVNPDGTASIDQPKLTKALAASGHGSVIPKILKDNTDFQKSTAELSELRGKVAVAEQDYAGSVGAAMKAANHDPRLFLVTAQHAIDAKAVDPNTVAPLMQQVQQALAQDPTGEVARALVAQISDHFIAQSPAQQKLINEGKTAQAAADSAASRVQGAATGAKRLTAELPGIEAGNTVKQQEASGTKPIQPAEAARLAGEAEARGETKNFHRQTVSQGAQRIGLASQANQIHAAEADPYGQLGVNQRPIGGSDLHGDEYLKTLPSILAAKVRGVLNGDLPLPVARGGQLKGEGKALSDAVFQADPQFSVQRATVSKDFSPAGASGKNIQALNTATVHLDQLGEAAKALSNNSFQPGNAAFNGLVTMFGGSAPTSFAGIRAAVSSEMATALKGSATDQEIHAIQTTIDGASSPKQLADIVDTHLHVLGAKLNTKSEEHRKAIPGDEKYTPVLPTAARVFEKHGIKPIAGPKISVISPEGVPGIIDADKWDAAEKRGFKKQ